MAYYLDVAALIAPGDPIRPIPIIPINALVIAMINPNRNKIRNIAKFLFISVNND